MDRAIRKLYPFSCYYVKCSLKHLYLKLLEISGPPEFLNNSVEEAGKDVDGQRRGRRKYSRNKNDLPAGTFLSPTLPLNAILHEGIYCVVIIQFGSFGHNFFKREIGT